jgi:translocation and assembly module TamB
VQKGIIDFINPYKIEPTIDIAAQSQVRHWTINLAVTGPPDDLSVQLRSSPTEEHSDIISLLVVGKTTRELAGGEGGGATSPQQLLANLLAEQLQKNLQAGTGLDIIELEYTTNGESDTGDDIRVTVGKEISRRLTLLYGVEQRSGLVVQKSTAIYKLLENLSVNAFQDTEGAFGGEMRYRLEFR